MKIKLIESIWITFAFICLGLAVFIPDFFAEKLLIKESYNNLKIFIILIIVYILWFSSIISCYIVILISLWKYE